LTGSRSGILAFAPPAAAAPSAAIHGAPPRSPLGGALEFKSRMSTTWNKKEWWDGCNYCEGVCGCRRPGQ